MADAAHLVTLLGEGPAERKEAFEALEALAARGLQDQSHVDAAVACTSALCAAMCRDASEVDLEEFQRMSELLLALAALDPIRVGGELLKPTQPSLSAICMSTESVFGAALSKNPRAGHELTEAGARKN